MKVNVLFFTTVLLLLGIKTKAQNVPNNSTNPSASAKKLPVAYTGTPANFIRVYVPQKPITDTGWITPAAMIDTIVQQTVFSDGLGRPIETVIKQGSPTKKDNVSATVFDEFGRQPIQYLPFASTTADGSFKTNPFYQDSAFYKTMFPTESINYGQTLWDGSPFNIPTKILAPGNSWGGAGVGPQFASMSNTAADSVVLFTITNSTEDDMPVKWGMYAVGSLVTQQLTDERGIKVITYTNTLGRTVLTKTQISASPSTGHTGWLCTYYVYDELNRLRVVVPPKAVDALNSGFNFASNTSIFNNLCFVYFYDNRGRQVMKRIPGKGKSYTAYDLMDRAVMTQDPKLRLTNQWAFVLYDNQFRPDSSGIITTALIKDSVLAQAKRSTSYPTLNGVYTVTSINFYDDYNWVSGTGGAITTGLVTTDINSSNFFTTYNVNPDYAQQIVQGNRTRGRLTGSKRIVLNSANYLFTLQIYDVEGRPVQTKQTNYSGGTDVSTIQYSFAGSVLRSHLAHQKSGTNAQAHTVLYKYTYDHAGRLLTVVHKLNSLAEKTISQFIYNELGKVQEKIVGGGIDEQNYTYNIRGWLTSINKDFVGGSVTPLTSGGFFGENIYYNFGFTNNQLNGNISGIKWKQGGDTTTRAYGYAYDNANRLTTANYSQAGSGWVNNVVDYTTSNINYDGNGNILTMKQRGLLLGNSSTIDSLTYQYFANTNQLQKVTDGIAAVATRRGDFQDTASIGDDYVYDANGNIIKDNNRHLHSTAGTNGAVFNVLDKADSIGIAGRSGTKYYYDAGGALLKKEIATYGAGGSTQNWLYIGGFVYKNDTLQYAFHSEGSIRYARKILSTTGAVYYAYEYDYYIKDRQGNIRNVITEGRDTATYQATIEPALQTYEDSLFSNIYSPTTTYVSKPSGFDSDAANTRVIKLNSGGNKTGAGITLKVMAGDKVQLNCFAYYTGATQAPSGPSLLNDILTALSNGVVNNSGGKVVAVDQSTVSSLLSPNVTSFLNGRSYDTAKPKAYLNWVLVDNQFKYVQGGVVQVLSGGSKQALVASLQTMSKNGYLYAYVSNESPQDVFFDDITVKHYTGTLVQEQSYYPFGVQMAAISDKAVKKNGTSYKYNAGCEFEDEMDYYNTFYRKYDPQIGRFTGVDILSESTVGLSPFQFGTNNPVMFLDPSGARFARGRLEKGTDGQYHVGWVSEMQWNNFGFFSWGNLGDGGGGGGYENLDRVTSDFLLSHMGFGDYLGKNRAGKLVVWTHQFFVTERDEDGGENMSEVSHRWVSRSVGKFGWQMPTFMQGNWSKTSSGDENNAFVRNLRSGLLKLWNSDFVRHYVPDKLSVGLNIHGAAFVGAGTTPVGFTFLTRGNDAGMYFTPSVNVSASDGFSAGANVSVSLGNYTGDPNEISASMLEGHTIEVSAMLGLGIEGSLGTSYSLVTNNPFDGGFINSTGSIGMGLDVSPITGATIQVTDQVTLKGTVQTIFNFK